MPESSSSSFIPKRSPANKPAVSRRGNFLLLSVISYSLFVAAPLASLAVFIYERHTQNQFDKAVIALDAQIVDFKNEDLKRVVDFDERLKLSQKLLASHISVSSVLKSIESATAETVKFNSLTITRTDLDTVSVSAELVTSDFDGELFQRSTYMAKPIFKNVLFSATTVVTPTGDTESGSGNASEQVTFKASFDFAATDVAYKATQDAVSAITTDVPTAEVTDSDADTTSTTSSSTTNI